MNQIKNFFSLHFLLVFISILNTIYLQTINPYINKVINYTESIKTIKNPGIGYTNTFWLKAKRNNVQVSNLIGSVVLMFIDIGEYSSGINEDKIDYDLDSSFFETLQKNFENCRKNGATIALRFRYDSNGI